MNLGMFLTVMSDQRARSASTNHSLDDIAWTQGGMWWWNVVECGGGMW